MPRSLPLALLLISPLTSPGEDTKEMTKQENLNLIQVKDGDSIQAAIKSAKPHSTIRIAKGTFQESLIIDKPLTIEGEGWNQTILAPVYASNPKLPKSTFVTNAKGVVIRNLQITISNYPKNQYHSLLEVEGSGVTLEGCALLGPSANGLVIRKGSEVGMSNSLVAAVWGTGIRVAGKGESKASSLQLDRSVIRSCYHRCVTLGAGCDDSSITRSWISGSAWHGIRYDSASPTINHNYIGGNARSGIYASGTTKAKISHNVFEGNEMGGISCWFNNEDQIEANYFLNNRRESISAIGSSKPILKRNWFIRKGGVAVVCSFTQKDKNFGAPVLEGNLADHGVSPLRKGEEIEESVEGISVLEKPHPRNFGESILIPGLLWPEGPLTPPVPNKDPIHRSKLWPDLLPSELTIVPDGVSRNYQHWKTPESREKKQKAQMASVRQEAQKWVQDAFQLDDVARKDRAVSEMLTAIKSNDPLQQAKGLHAFIWTREVRFDKQPFHEPAVALLNSSDPETVSTAAGALIVAGLQEGDLDRLLKLTRHDLPKIRLAGASNLIWALENKLTKEPYAGAIAALLKNTDTQKDILRSLWGATLSPAIEAEVLKLSKSTKVSEANTNDIAYTALYHALSTQANKSEASVKRLIEYLAAQDTHNIAGRAAWGLGQGVDPAQHDLIVAGSLRFMGARTPQSYAFRQSLARLKQYAAKRHLADIEAFLKKPALGDELKKELLNLGRALKAPGAE